MSLFGGSRPLPAALTIECCFPAQMNLVVVNLAYRCIVA
jgi:hypothetical protein